MPISVKSAVESLSVRMRADIELEEGLVVVFGPGPTGAHYRLRQSIKTRIEECSRAKIRSVFPEELAPAYENEVGEPTNFALWEEYLMQMPEVVLGIFLITRRSSGPSSELPSIMLNKSCARKLLVLLPNEVAESEGFERRGTIELIDGVFRNVRPFAAYEEARSLSESVYRASELWCWKYKTWPLVEQTIEELIDQPG